MTEPRHSNGSKGGDRRATGDLASRIAAAKRDREQEVHQASLRGVGSSSNLARGLRLGSEFIAAILVGAGSGFLLDLWLGTSPWIMLVMLMVGFAAGILNVTRAVGDMNKASPPPPGSDLGPENEDETT